MQMIIWMGGQRRPENQAEAKSIRLQSVEMWLMSLR